MKRFPIIRLFVIILLGTIATPAFAQSVYDVTGNGAGNNASPRFTVYYRISATEGSGAGLVSFSRTLTRNDPPDIVRIYADGPLNAKGIRYDLATRKFIIQETKATQVFGNTAKGCDYTGTMTVELTDGGNDPTGDVFSAKFTPTSRAAMKEGCPRPKSVSWRARLANGPGITIRKLK